MKAFQLNTVVALLLPTAARAAYTVLQESYTPANFFSKFDYFTGNDPTNGFVRYQSQSSATALNLLRTSASDVYIGVDTTTVTPSGRPSVRLESKARFQRGLFILDAAHMPVGCGTWPAFWTVGDSWPNNGEVDIIEGVHNQPTNSVALHTSDGCTVNGSGGTGTVLTRNCFVSAPGQSSNQGCSTSDTRTSSYGSGFNSIGGGVYAMEWTNQFIKVWFFPRGAIPANALSGNPAPEGWGAPAAMFQGSCDIDQKFRSHRIIINTTFCGDWAGNVWGGSGCQSRAATCQAFVRDNPAAFAEAYWRINSLKVWSS